MICPKCENKMNASTYRDVEYDQCQFCGGLWFDALEAEELVEERRASDIDTGNKRTGVELNKKRNINCPKCSTQMQRVHDIQNPHIQLESCPSCYGTFFDAGEFKDFCKETGTEPCEENFMDRIRDWFVKKG